MKKNTGIALGQDTCPKRHDLHEATRTNGLGAELSALIQEHCFYQLEAPIERVTGWDTPYPHAQEWSYFPGPARLGAALQRVMEA